MGWNSGPSHFALDMLYTKGFLSLFIGFKVFLAYQA